MPGRQHAGRDAQMAVTDHARRVAADLAITCRRLTDLAAELEQATADPLWRPKYLTRPLRDDLAAARRRIDTVLRG